MLDGLFKLLGKVSDQVQGRIERLKNEKAALLDERFRLFQVSPISARSVDRLNAIDKRLCEIETILSNKASD